METGNGKKILPGKYFNLIDGAINTYWGKVNDKEWNEEKLINFAKYTIKEINNYFTLTT
jgi:hypothetical protein